MAASQISGVAERADAPTARDAAEIDNAARGWAGCDRKRFLAARAGHRVDLTEIAAGGIRARIEDEVEWFHEPQHMLVLHGVQPAPRPLTNVRAEAPFQHRHRVLKRICDDFLACF